MASNNPIEVYTKKMAVIFLLIVTSMFGSFAILYTIHDILILKYLTIFYTIQHIVWIIFFLRYKQLPIEPAILMYITCIIVILFPIICISANSGYPVVFFWYALVPIGVIAFEVKDITMWTVITLIASISAYFLSPHFPNENFSLSLINSVNFMTIAWVFIMTTFFVGLFVKKNEINKATKDEETTKIEENKEDLEKYKVLYNEIIEHLDKVQPFKNPDFDEAMLAKNLETNSHYISSAINVVGETNFKTLLKEYRIKYVKSLIDSDALKRYTIDYIFTEAGYRSRSTFNNAFKNVIGMTPSDYVVKKK